MSELSISKIIRDKLFELQDLDYRAFQSNLTPSITEEDIIGVRTPVLRNFAKEMVKDPDIDAFFKDLPHKYYDENNMHGFMLSLIKDFDEVIRLLDEFLPYVDNWATCDMMRPKVFAKHKKELLPHIYRWMESENTYTVRFAIEMLMTYYLDEDFDLEYPRRISKIRSEEYYINMMIAWYFATALAKQYDAILPFFVSPCMDKWTHNKAIQKARESYRVTAEQKEYLNTLKIK